MDGKTWTFYPEGKVRIKVKTEMMLMTDDDDDFFNGSVYFNSPDTVMKILEYLKPLSL